MKLSNLFTLTTLIVVIASAHAQDNITLEGGKKTLKKTVQVWVATTDDGQKFFTDIPPKINDKTMKKEAVEIPIIFPTASIQPISFPPILPMSPGQNPGAALISLPLIPTAMPLYLPKQP